MTAAHISDRLHWYALIPEPDFFFTVRNACADAVVALGEQAGPHLFTKYPATRLHGLHDAFGYLMHRAVGLDAVQLAPPMTELGDRLQRLLTDIADDHTALPDIRAAPSPRRSHACTEDCRHLTPHTDQQSTATLTTRTPPQGPSNRTSTSDSVPV
ncbi:hypothetical protein [Nocardia jiangxiensis]|uniref:hypothetical protein n=1 Tax=Nocardia jiangxiensis TaxID=282685 RepID=UPI0002FD7572|nr:hypothetical protein [Nocardia jiangxiensis]